NGPGPGRVRHPDRSRHDETALSNIASDDVATQGAQAGDNPSTRRTRDPEFRRDQGPCGTLGRTARINRLALPGQLPDPSGRASQYRKKERGSNLRWSPST